MEEQPDPYKKFNKYTKQLYKELLKLFPKDPILSLAQASFVLMKNMNKQSPAEYFKKAIALPYSDDIITKRTFFMDDAFNIPICDGFNKKLRDTWNVLDEANRTALWDHIHVLVVLSKRCEKDVVC
jgi:hypothetical protein